jgi:hypothetical protein
MRLSKDADEVSRLSFALWFSRNCNVLTSLTFLSMDVGLHGFKTTVQCLPCPQLQNLRLRGLPLQLQPSDGHAGVLHHCSGLTALTLDQCEIQDGEAAFAALAALPQLQHLVIEVPFNKEYLHLLPALQQMSSLTNLNLDYWSTYEAAGCEDLWQELSEQMEQQSPFSGLVNLQQLRWISPSQGTPFDGLPGGLPSQLVKLTNLDVNYDYVPTARSQLQQLSSMTALRDLNINIYNSYDTLPDFSVLEKLSQLTSLGIKCSNLSISAASTSAWASCLTALERLTLIQCDVQPAALAALTQLRALRLAFYEGFAEGHDLLVELSKLQLLTELQVQLEYIPDPRPAAPAEAELSVLPPAAAFLTSTNLCSLQLGLQNHWDTPLRNWVLFTPGALYPHLRCIDMAFEDESTYGLSWTGLVPLSEQQLQQLCSCCPAVRSLAFMAQQAPSPTAFLPLQQLSALTQLGIHSIPQLTDPALIPLTALTALKQLQLSTLDTSEPHGYHKPEDTLSLCNEVSSSALKWDSSSILYHCPCLF